MQNLMVGRTVEERDGAERTLGYESMVRRVPMCPWLEGRRQEGVLVGDGRRLPAIVARTTEVVGWRSVVVDVLDRFGRGNDADRRSSFARHLISNPYLYPNFHDHYNENRKS